MMDMQVSQIYEDYLIPENLQKHTSRVAALAEIILENWKGKEIDKKAVIKACLFHDIAKPLNFDLAKQVEFGMSRADIEKLDKLQKNLKSQYGNDEHHAMVKICEEIGLSPTSVGLVNNLEWKYIPRLLKENNIESLIPIYCDMRIGPKGILSLIERLDELENRINSKDYEQNLKNGILLEELIKKNVLINLNSVTDNQINSRFENLLKQKI